jgi:glycosyltransferase involved in cell wall biosynthesis
MTVRPVEFIYRESVPEVLVITNMWPEHARPVYGVFVERQVQALRAAGVRCDVLYIRGYLSKLSYLVSVPLFLWLTVFARGRYRLTHIHAGETALAARFFIMRPMLVTYHGDDILGYRSVDGGVPLRSRIRSYVIRAHARLFAATVTQSREMHRRLPRRVQRRNTIIRCGVDTAEFCPKERSKARARLGWEDCERVVLFAATRPHDPLKRHDLAQAVVARAEEELGFIRLVVAEDEAPDVMPVLMNAADCLLVTSMSEGGPLVVKEALMCNLPVVSTDVGDVREMLVGVSPSAVCGSEASELGAALVQVLRANTRSNGQCRRDDVDQSATVNRLRRLYFELGLREDRRSTRAAAVTR